MPSATSPTRQFKYLIGAIFLIIALIGIYFYRQHSTGSETVEGSEVTNNTRTFNSDVEPTNNVPVVTPLATNPSTITSSTAKYINENEVDSLIESHSTNDSSVTYMSIEDSGLPPPMINELKQDFSNLREYGSYSGGVITNEFTTAEYFKSALTRNGELQNILAKLNFVPTDVGAILGNDFKLVGADYSGAQHEGKFNSIFRYYEDGQGERFEINEMYLTPANNASLEVYKESINFNLAEHPATLQKLKSASSEADEEDIYNLDFNVGRRVFSISSEGMDYDKFIQTSLEIVNVVMK